MDHPSPPLCSLRGIGKSFSGVPVLRQVSLDLHAGEVHVLAGENGAGKSTLIKILAGVHREYEGEVRLGGRPVRFASPQEGQAAGIAVIHQEMSLVGGLSVADNIFLGRELTGRWGGVDRRTQAAAAREALGRVGVELDVSRPVEHLSLALRQLVEIAKALAQEASILVMDEPTSALSDPEVEALFTLVEELRRQGRAIVYISHRMEEIVRLADRITVLRDGGHVCTLPAAELPPEELVRRMVGREVVDRYPDRTAEPAAERLRLEGVRVEDPDGGGRPAIADLSLVLRRGEILGLAGLEGSGRSVLLHALFGDYGPLAAGTAVLDGVPLAVRSPARSIAAGVALLTGDRQGSGLVLGLDLVANATLASLARHGRTWRDGVAERRAVAARSEELGIRAADPSRPVATLSGGNQQKVVFAKWLETRPRLLLLDEPTRGVDVGAKQQIYALLNRLTEEGMGILLVSSDLPELMGLSDRILVLHRGRITATLDRPEYTPEAILRAAMDEAAEAVP